MKKMILPVIFLLAVTVTSAQEGTSFRDIELPEALSAAQTEGKQVFLDAYTSWCGPCKMMASRIFPLAEVGQYMNEHFVSVKYDMEKGKGPEMAARYQIDAYPTFLIINPDGTLAGRIVGAYPTGEEFLDKIRSAMDADNPINKMGVRYEQGDRSAAFIREYYEALLEEEDMMRAAEITDGFLLSLPEDERFTDTAWFIFESPYLTMPASANGVYFLQNEAKFRAGVGDAKVDAKLYEFYELRLDNVLRRRDRQTSLDQVRAWKDEIAKSNMPSKELLVDYADYIDVRAKNDTEAMLTIAERILPGMPDWKLSYLYFIIAMDVARGMDAGQKERLLALTDKLRFNSEDTRFTSSVEAFLDSSYFK